MKIFDPFNKHIDDIDALDLAVLKTIQEGWYIEYKQEIPKSESIAKSVSAMANSYGGWVFYGIQEESKENSVAGAFLGLDIESIDSTLQKVRQAVAAAISPDCHYEIKVVHGPCEEIGLTESKCIICIAVPQSIEAPHVHSKGVIYRRVADGSEPVPETDRHMIEKMFQRSSKTIDSFTKWIERDPELSEEESDAPYLRLLIAPNLWQTPRKNFKPDIKNINIALNKIEGRGYGIPFDTIYSSATGVIARQCANNDPMRATLTWHFHSDMSSEILAPLQWAKGDAVHLLESFEKANNILPFLESLASRKIKKATVINLNILYSLIRGIIEAQREIFREAGWPNTFHIKTKLLNIWRTIPFIDCDFYTEHVEKYGIPVALTGDVISPPGSHPDTFNFIDKAEEGSSEEVEIMIQTMRCFVPIAEAFGIPMRHLLVEDLEANSGEEDYSSILLQLWNIGAKPVKT